VPVWRPFRDHSVSPWRTMKQRGAIGVFTAVRMREIERRELAMDEVVDYLCDWVSWARGVCVIADKLLIAFLRGY
jgi:hypothetical protein